MIHQKISNNLYTYLAIKVYICAAYSIYSRETKRKSNFSKNESDKHYLKEILTSNIINNGSTFAKM